jgi:hypothetical protein
MQEYSLLLPGSPYNVERKFSQFEDKHSFRSANA